MTNDKQTAEDAARECVEKEKVMTKKEAEKIYQWYKNGIPFEVVAELAVRTWPNKYLHRGDCFSKEYGKSLILRSFEVIKNNDDNQR